MVDFEQMKKQYELIKEGVMTKAEGTGFIIYSMGEGNSVIRIDVNENKKKK
jgi:hypothetical protein